MQLRTFGRTGMQLSVLGFGCGAVGGFMVRGDPAEQERVVARAIAAGVNYFDTAVQYGDGESEKNLGRVLRKLKPANAIVGTKVRLPPSDFGRIAARAFDSAQIVYNMLNPSAAEELPQNYPAQDYGRMFDHTRAAGVGVVGIRVLAGGALSGSIERHPIAGPAPEPIGSAMSYDADVERARRLMPLVKEGFAASLTEAATRFALSHPAMGTILVGMATPHQFEEALTAAEKGPLPQAALDRLSELRQAFSGEAR